MKNDFIGEWVIKIHDLECEFGSSIPVRFINPEDVKMYDNEGKEVPIPKCEKCGNIKQQIIGKNACAWICNDCPGDNVCSQSNES